MQKNSSAQNKLWEEEACSVARNEFVKQVQANLSRLSVNASPAHNPIKQRVVSEAENDRIFLSSSAQNQNWQASKTEIKERVAFMFNNEKLADIHFIVGKGTGVNRIPAHRFVLSIGSSVFYAMFNGSLATKSDEIEIPDIEPAAFFAFLRFLYTDEVRIDSDTVMSTFYAAKKYAVPALEFQCVKFLQNNLSCDNAFMLLTQARLFDEPELTALCLKMIDENTTEALAAEGFTDIDIDTLNYVIKRDTLRTKEIKLFQAVLKWAEAECERQDLPVTPENQRSVLGRTLKLIRFPLMTVDEFATGAAQSGILSDKEVVSLFLYFTVNPKVSIDFNDTPRSSMSGHELVVTRFQQVEMRWGYSGLSDRIRFIVDHPIFVLGFGLYGSVYVPVEYSVSIQLVHTPTNKLLGLTETTFNSDGSSSVFRVMFEEPIQVLANNSYTATVTMRGPDSHYGTKGLRKVHVDTPVGKVTFQFTYSAGNNNGSSVEYGQIPQILFYT